MHANILELAKKKFYIREYIYIDLQFCIYNIL